mmetsp:Transcript_117802/g.186522  ORF Transcript_117802/g.186522 Transcript_117802/m.186522 type:complete len:828 (-) Transcript_117802:71-2554(-)
MAIGVEADDAHTRIQNFASGALTLEHLAKVEESIDFQNATRVGSGSLGDVLQVKELASQRPLAIKVISRSKVNTRGVGEDRLQREVQVMSELKHPNVVRLVDVLAGLQQLPCVSSGSEPPYLCIVMELIDASWPLSYEIRRSGAQPKLVTKVLPQLASGLGEIHSKGIVHRDVWSENVLINKDGQIVLVDLGCAECMTGPTVCRNLNIPYLSPQAARCEKQHPSDDAWAAGLLVTEMATGLFVLQRLGRTDIPIHKVPGALSNAIAETQSVTGNVVALLVQQLLDLEYELRPSMPEVLTRLEAESTDGADVGHPLPPASVRRSVSPMRAIPSGSPPPVIKPPSRWLTSGGNTPIASPAIQSVDLGMQLGSMSTGYPAIPIPLRAPPPTARLPGRKHSLDRSIEHESSMMTSRTDMAAFQSPSGACSPGYPGYVQRPTRNNSYARPCISMCAPPGGSATPLPPTAVFPATSSTPSTASLHIQRAGTPQRLTPFPASSMGMNLANQASVRLAAPQASEGSGAFSRSNSVVRQGSFNMTPPSATVVTAPSSAPVVTLVRSPSTQGTAMLQESARCASQVVRQSSSSNLMAPTLSYVACPSEASWVPTPGAPSVMHTDKASSSISSSRYAASAGGSTRFLQAKPGAVIRQVSSPGVVRQQSFSAMPPSGVVVAVAPPQIEDVRSETADSRQSIRRIMPTSRDNANPPSLRQAWVSEMQRSQRRGADSSRWLAPGRPPSGNITERSGSVSGIARERPVMVEASSPAFFSDRERMQSFYVRQGDGVHHRRQENGNANPTAVYAGEAGDILRGLQKRMEVLSTQLPPARRRAST